MTRSGHDRVRPQSALKSCSDFMLFSCRDFDEDDTRFHTQVSRTWEQLA